MIPGVMVMSNTTLVFFMAVRMLLKLTESSSWATESLTLCVKICWDCNDLAPFSTICYRVLACDPKTAYT